MNSICLMGRLTADPELKTTQSGLSVTSFSLAVDRPYASKERERVTDFISCVAWRQTAEFVTRYFRKGNRMAAKGSLQSRSYEARDGSRRTSYEVVVDEVFFCEPKGAGATFDEEIPPPAEPPAGEPIMQNVEKFVDITVDEELPI